MGKPIIWPFGFRPGLAQTGLYSHRSRLEDRNLGFKKKKDCTLRAEKTKVLISFAVTAKLTCAFVFPKAKCWFSHAVVQHVWKNRTDCRRPHFKNYLFFGSDTVTT